PLDEYRNDWNKISGVLKDALANVSEEKLDSPDPMEMPGGPYTFLDTIVACTDRESYCIGQIGLWRRLLGYEAMKYT
ncbi:MAG: DinB family protein, partial [Parafilimonas sp.]